LLTASDGRGVRSVFFAPAKIIQRGCNTVRIGNNKIAAARTLKIVPPSPPRFPERLSFAADNTAGEKNPSEKKREPSATSERKKKDVFRRKTR